jgi:hypothetical protein
MLAESVDEDEVIARVAAVDVGKAELPATTTPANPHAASAPQPPRRRAGAVNVERPTGRTTLTATSADAHSQVPKPRS